MRFLKNSGGENMFELEERDSWTPHEDNGPVGDAFVLRVRKDPVAWLVSWDYANLTQNAELATALHPWLVRNTPSEETLDSEGRTNQLALGKVQDIITAAVSRRQGGGRGD
jgi:hypothetical protein